MIKSNPENELNVPKLWVVYIFRIVHTANSIVSVFFGIPFFSAAHGAAAWRRPTGDTTLKNARHDVDTSYKYTYSLMKLPK